MAPRPDVSEDRRNQILDTAEDVFAKHGFDETRMDDLAERSGLSKGAIYWYFKKKDDIIGALLDRVFRRSIAAIRRIAEEQATAGQRLLRIGEQISHDYRAMSRLMPIALEFYAVALRQRSIRKHLAAIYEQLLSILVPLIEEGVRNGEFANRDARRAATIFIGSYEGLGLLWAISPKLVDWRLEGPEAARIFLKGLEKR
jgi:AcrR family transcriptional regulator